VIVTNWARRHKLVTSITAVSVVVVAVLSVMTSGSGTTTHTDRKAPSFSLPVLGGTSGQKVSLTQYAGKPLIVNFWASWCGPCQQETPLLARWYRQEKGRVALVGLDENDTTTAALKFARAKGVTYPLAYDTNMAAAGGYLSLAAIPQTFFLNSRHQIVDQVAGAVTAANLAKALKLMETG
jgi:cytochrome c biogenesis protein CcmG/thiol:disulfide interchange protein DsbE